MFRISGSLPQYLIFYRRMHGNVRAIESRWAELKSRDQLFCNNLSEHFPLSISFLSLFVSLSSILYRNVHAIEAQWVELKSRDQLFCNNLSKHFPLSISFFSHLLHFLSCLSLFVSLSLCLSLSPRVRH